MTEQQCRELAAVLEVEIEVSSTWRGGDETLFIGMLCPPVFRDYSEGRKPPPNPVSAHYYHCWEDAWDSLLVWKSHMMLLRLRISEEETDELFQACGEGEGYELYWDWITSDRPDTRSRGLILADWLIDHEHDALSELVRSRTELDAA